MNRQDLPSDDSFEADAVWKLLDEATPAEPRASFADDLVRMAKLEPVTQPWWKSWRVMAPSFGLAAAAVVALTFVISAQRESEREKFVIDDSSLSIPKDDFADLQEFADTETLIAAADHLDDFSDQELAGLIGF